MKYVHMPDKYCMDCGVQGNLWIRMRDTYPYCLQCEYKKDPECPINEQLWVAQRKGYSEFEYTWGIGVIEELQQTKYKGLKLI